MSNVANLPGVNQQQIRINIDSLLPFLCPECSGDSFSPIFRIKALSRITSPNGQPGALHHQVGFVCIDCGWQMDLQGIADACKNLVETKEIDNES